MICDLTIRKNNGTRKLSRRSVSESSTQGPDLSRQTSQFWIGRFQKVRMTSLERIIDSVTVFNIKRNSSVQYITARKNRLQRSLPATCVKAISFKVTNTAYEGDPSIMSFSFR